MMMLSKKCTQVFLQIARKNGLKWAYVNLNNASVILKRLLEGNAQASIDEIKD